jgi:hypothetical protein
MIKLATQQPHIHNDLNMLEAKHDPALGFMKSRPGVSQNFNELRVLPSPQKELQYPDLREGIAFYDKIGCPHLKYRFKIPTEANHSIKPTISEVLQKKYLDNLSWNMWEVKAKDVGKTKKSSNFLKAILAK